MTRRTRNSLISSTVFWAVILVAFGGVRRWVDAVLIAPDAVPIVLERPLSSLPMTFGMWEGHDVPIDTAVLRVAGTDDHVSRMYQDIRAGAAVNLYFAYTAQPVKMLGHRPDVCYPANGWQHLSTEKVEIPLSAGNRLEALVHQFTRDAPHAEGLVVLNYYILQGRHTTEWTDFWGPRWRVPNFARDPNYYVAQVQIAATAMVPAMFDRARESVMRFAAAVADEIDFLLPMTSGAEENVKVTVLSTRPHSAGRRPRTNGAASETP